MDVEIQSEVLLRESLAESDLTRGSVDGHSHHRVVDQVLGEGAQRRTTRQAS